MPAHTSNPKRRSPHDLPQVSRRPLGHRSIATHRSGVRCRRESITRVSRRHPDQSTDATQCRAVRCRRESNAMHILDAIKDQKVFGQHFRADTWTSWLAFLAALFALPMTDEQLELYRQHTGRTTPPTGRRPSSCAAPRRPRASGTTAAGRRATAGPRSASRPAPSPASAPGTGCGSCPRSGTVPSRRVRGDRRSGRGRS